MGPSLISAKGGSALADIIHMLNSFLLLNISHYFLPFAQPACNFHQSPVGLQSGLDLHLVVSFCFVVIYYPHILLAVLVDYRAGWYGQHAAFSATKIVILAVMPGLMSGMLGMLALTK